MSNDVALVWEDRIVPPRERAEALVAVMTLAQKIAQVHGAMETIDICTIAEQARESDADMDSLDHRPRGAGHRLRRPRAAANR